MSKTITFASALAAALLVASAGSAAAQSGDGLSSEGLGTASASGSSATETDPAEGTEAPVEEGYLGSAGELLPGSVTGSLPGYTTGPLGSTATLACNVGTIASAAAGLTGVPLPIPVGMVCMVLNPVAESGDSLLAGDVDGSVGAIVGGIPLIGGSIGDKIDTSSVTEKVQGSIGEEGLGSLTESSLSPAN